MANTSVDQETIDRALNAPMSTPDGVTVSQYLCLAVTNLWREGESFSGKRPVDNSDWQWRIYGALHTAGLIDGKPDGVGGFDDIDWLDAP